MPLLPAASVADLSKLDAASTGTDVAAWHKGSPTVRQPQDSSSDSEESDAERKSSEVDTFGLFNEEDATAPKPALLEVKPKRSNLFVALNTPGRGEAEACGAAGIGRAVRSAPELRRSQSRSVMEDIESNEAGEFRNCRHCKAVFPYIRTTDASHEQLRSCFCSGECHLTYATLFHLGQQQHQQQQLQQHQHQHQQQQQRVGRS
jgi:hypothetical protein